MSHRNIPAPPASGIRPADRSESAIMQDGWNASYDYVSEDDCPHPEGSRARALWIAGWNDQDASRRDAIGDDLERMTRGA